MTYEQPYGSIAAIGTSLAAVASRHIDRAFRHILRGPQVVCEPGFVRLITGDPHPFGNAAVLTDAADLPRVQTAVGPLLRCGAPAAVLFTSPVANAVREWLRGAGFESRGGMPAMAVEIDSLSPTRLPPGYSLARVDGGAESDEWTRTFAIGYEIPVGVAAAFSPSVVQATTAADAPIQYFAIRRGGAIVTTSVVSLADGVAGVYCVATVPDERGRGLGAHATAEALRLVRDLGYRVGVLQSTPAGHSVYRKLGFTDVGEVALYMKAAG